MKENDIAALQPKHLYFMLKKRYTTGIERQRLLQKFMKSFEFGGCCSPKERMARCLHITMQSLFHKRAFTFTKKSLATVSTPKQLNFNFTGIANYSPF
jgi:hypothetical protein